MDELGQYVSIDLVFKSGKRLSELPAYKDNHGVAMSPGFARGSIGGDYENFICEIGKGELLGDEITGIVLAYNKQAASGSFNALIDDITIATSLPLFPVGITDNFLKVENLIYIENETINFKNFDLGTEVAIYDILGKEIKIFKLNTTRVIADLPIGIYLVAAKLDKGTYAQKIVIGK